MKIESNGYSRERSFAGVLLIVILSLFITNKSAHAAAPQFCYESACFSNLPEAEAEMRSHFGYGKFLEREGTEPANQYLANSAITFVYVAPDQPPIKFNPPSYSVGGWDNSFYAGFCQPAGDPYYPNRCASEQEAMESMKAYWQRTYPTCSFTNYRIEGNYGEPFVSSRGDAGFGFLSFMTPQDKWFKNDAWCPGWGQSYPDKWQHQLVKIQTFNCPSEYWPIWGYNPTYNNTGNPDYIALWPYLCTAGKPTHRISKIDSTGPKQTSSCPANENPCFPATGDKMRTEPDLSFAGREFTRYYHSLQEIQISGAIGLGWGHTFLEKIIYNGNTNRIQLFSEKGYLQTFTSAGSRIYRGDQDPTDQLRWIDDGSWTLIRGNGERRTYSSMGDLQEIFSPSGPVYDVALSYSRGRLALALDGAGRALRFSYDGKGLLQRVALDDGTGVSYEHDQSKNLTKVIYQDGSSRSYRYDEPHLAPASIGHLLTGIFDNDVRYATFRYDAQGNVSGSMLHSGSNMVAKTVITYAGAGQATVTGPLGAVSNYTLSLGPFPQVTGITDSRGSLSSSFDERGRPRGGTDRNGVSTRRDFVDTADSGLLVRETLSSQAGALRTTEVTRGASNHIASRNVISASGRVSAETSKYSALGLILASCRYDLAIAEPSVYECGSQSSAPSGVRQTIYQYCDASGQVGCPQEGLIRQTTERGQVVKYTYFDTDDVGCSSPGGICLHRRIDLWKITNALGRITEYLAYDGAGRPLSIKDTNGIVTDYTYHPRGWLTATKVRGADDSSEADDRITRIDYWPAGLVKQVTQPDGAFTAFSYDAAHRLTDITDNAGNTVHYTLDNAGNRIKEDTSDASGTLKRTLSRVYNQLGQLKTQATAASDPTDFAYDANGNATTVTDALATATQSEYDPLNRLSRTLQDVAGIKADTKFEYDALDNLTKVTDPKGLDTTYDYNGFGDLVKLTSPDTGVTSYTYDSAGNRATQTDARGNTTAYSYDALNRLTKVTYPTTSLNVTYTYDVTQTACASGETFSIGRLTKMQDGGAITQYCYNRFGDLVRKVQTSNSKALVLRYDYTVGGQLRRMTYPDGAVVDYVRNAQGQTTQVGVTPAGGSRQVLLGNASYYPFGPAAGWTYGNGRTLARQYDLDYRPQAIQDTRPGGLEVGFGFDPAGNLTALTPAGNTTPEIGLGYDTLGRLTGFKDGRTGTLIDGYSYDATGNRLSAKVGTATQVYAYPTDSHRLSAVAGVARTYDATGNTTAIGGTARQYTYDTTGRMTQARRAGAVTMNYRYNGRGEQVRRFLGTTNTYTLYDEAGHWLGDYDSNGAPKQQAIWLEDLPVGLLANANKLHYIEPDHLGSPRVVIDPTRDVAVWTWSLKGEAFGNTAPNQDPDGDGAALVLDMRFPGQRYDAASGVFYNYQRYLDSGVGRYVQSDLIGLRGGVSTYGYALQSPLMNSDPYGLATWKGSTYSVGAGAAYYGGNIDFYQVTSPCPGGGFASAYVMALAAAGGVGSQGSMTGSQVELNDSNGVPDPEIFRGAYSKVGFGSIAFGLGHQVYQKISIGGATSTWFNFGNGADSSGCVSSPDPQTPHK
ncbi:RHS repeat-associated core domain-containing protein [Xanthomonas euvesicatoria]|uniref:RHS repeat-associated core domain-containing protein n=1 Tax=Xanthomonas euvesicatoria TaxID=456327 RepID=UPI001F25068D|nr:DUF6531 domain-containing protein [Xanthomonas campestris pv. coriandri]